MIKVSATKLRNHLFEYLDKASDGETIIIQRNNQDVAHIIPTIKMNWRERMSIEPKVLVSTEELIEPIADIWENYL